MQRSVLVDHDDYRLELVVPDHVDPDYDGKLLVGFGEIGSSLEGEGFGEALAARLGIAYVAVKQRRRTQYQFLSRKVVAEALTGLGSELYFYGTSIGGYCAAYYARPLGANFLALSPRVPANPVTKRRLAIEFATPGYLHEAIYAGPDLRAGRHVVVLDRGNSVDDFYLRTDLSIAYRDLEVHDVPGAGHYTPRALLLSKSLKSTVIAFLQDEPIKFTVDQQAVIAWNEERVYRLINEKRFGHASEHIEVLLRFQGREDIERHMRALNDAIVKSPREVRATRPGKLAVKGESETTKRKEPERVPDVRPATAPKATAPLGLRVRRRVRRLLRGPRL